MALTDAGYAAGITQLEERARTLEPAQIEDLIDAAGSAPTSGKWPASDLPFWFQGTAAVPLTADQELALTALWTRLIAGAAFAVSGEDVEAWMARPGLAASLDRLVQRRPDARIEGRATAVLERRFGGPVWKGFTALWNAACAALLEEHLEASLFADLQAAWRAVFHRPLQLSSVVDADPFAAWR